MWVPTEDDAVEMLARHFQALHRGRAVSKAAHTAFQLRARGDEDGYRIWQRVADQIRTLRRTNHVRARRNAEAA